MKYFLLFIFLSTLIFPVLAQQQIEWRQTNGPYGGTFNTLVISSDGTLYAGTTNGLYKSTNSGDNWVKDDSYIKKIGVDLLAINSKDEIIAASDTSIYILQNNNWVKSNNGLPSTNFHNIYIDKNDIIYLGTSAGIFRSSNNGEDWNSIFIFDQIDTYVTTGILVDYSNSIYIGTNNGFFKSIDDGISWINITPDTLNKWISAFTINAGEIIVSCYGAIYKSVDEGNNWVFLIQNIPSETLISITSVNISDLLACSIYSIYKSSDNGNSWIKLFSSSISPTQSPLYFKSIHIDRNGTPYVTAFFGLMRLNYDSSEWKLVANGIINTSITTLNLDYYGNLIAGTTYGIFLSSDEGMTWKSLNKNQNFGFITALSVNSKGYLYAGSQQTGPYRSTDNGNNWKSLTTNFEMRFVNDMVIDKYDAIYVATDWGLFKSTDYGDVWEKINLDSAISSIYSVATNSKGTVYVGGAGLQKLIKSTDNGKSWEIIDMSITGEIVNTIKINSKGYIYAGLRYKGELYRSMDDGKTWSLITNETELIKSYSLGSIYVSPSDILFIANNDFGGFKSTDYGDSWVKICDNNSVSNVNCFVTDYDGHIFAGSSNNGVYKSLQSDLKPVYTNLILQNFPNPFNNTTTIQYEIPTNNKVSIKLYDVLGNEIRTIFEGERPRGRYFAIIDGTNLSSGVYLIHLITNNFSKTIKTVLLK